MYRTWGGSLIVAAIASTQLAGCTNAVTRIDSSASRDHRCGSHVIVTFHHDVGQPAPDLVTDVAHSARVQLTLLRTAGPGLFVFSLAADDADPSCRNALERLRRDARVGSVDVDERRRAEN